MIRRSWGTIRSRVAISHAILASTTLLVFIVFSSSLFWWQLTHQLYRYAIQNVETAEGLLSFAPDGRLILREDYHNHPQTRLLQERLVEIRDFNNSNVLYRNERLGSRNLGGAPFQGEGTNYSPRSYHMSDGTRVLLVSHVHSLGNSVLLIRQAYSIDPLFASLKEFVAVLFFTLPLVLVCASWAGFQFASRTLEPLYCMIKMAERITPQRLDERLPMANPEDELGRLTAVINQLLQRLQSDFDQLRRFTSDVSHELRTPLAALRSVGEVGLQRSTDRIQYQDVIGSMLEEVNRLARLVESLLAISRMDAGQVRITPAECDVFEVLRQCVSLLEILAQEKSQSLIFNANGDAVIVADELMLRQAFVNIIHNAIKFTPAGGSIEIQASAKPSQRVEIQVIDNGPGIPKEDREQIFERFRRSSSDQTGAGLGLAIARWIVHAHKGRVWLNESASGGCALVIQLVGLERPHADEHSQTVKSSA
jgi:signal transduction histidine kinase